MKLNGSFFSNAALIVTLLISPTLSAQAKEVINYAQDHSRESYSQLHAAAPSAGKADHGAKSDDQGFVSKRTTALEFTFALVTVIGGLIFSERYQRNQEKQQGNSGGSNENNSVSLEEQLEHQDLPHVG